MHTIHVVILAIQQERIGIKYVFIFLLIFSTDCKILSESENLLN